jgi:transposase-like protein
MEAVSEAKSVPMLEVAVASVVQGPEEPVRPPDPEVAERPVRRRFSAEYKRQILREADRCTKKGELGTLMRREGLYSSHLTEWRRAREAGELGALGPKKRGRKAAPPNPLAPRVAKLEREKAALEHKVKQVEILLDIQKKASELLGIPLNPPGSEGNDS